MHLTHSTYGNEADICNILRQGKLKASKKTGNVKLHGWATNYIFFSVSDEKRGIRQGMCGNAVFQFKYEAFSEKCWYFRTSWGGDSLKGATKIDCSKGCSKKTMGRIFKVIRRKILAEIKKRLSRDTTDGKHVVLSKEIETKYSHELLVKNEIDLKPYLYKISIGDHVPEKFIKNIKIILDKKYKDVKLEITKW